MLAWLVGAALVLGFSRVRRLRDAAALGALFGATVALCGNVSWLADAGARYFLLAPAAAFALAALLCLSCGAVSGLLLGIGLGGAVRLPSYWAVPAVAAVWVTWEAAILWCVPHYPWASLAATQVYTPVLAQAASLCGQQTLSFVMVITGSIVALAIDAGDRRRRIMYLVLAAGILAAVAVFGWRRLMTSLAATRCRVAGIDAGIASPDEPRNDVLQRYAANSAKAMRTEPSLLIWPESALPGFVETDGQLRARLEQFATKWHTSLLAGGPRLGWSGTWQRRLYNSVYGISADAVMQVYDKRYLVPLAEYWPSFLGRRPSWLMTDELAAGTSPMVYTTAACRVGVLICFEADHPELTQELVRRNAQAVMVLANDAQLPPAGVANELAQIRLRAIESGVPMVRIANRGASVLVDPFGRITAREIGGVLSTQLPLTVRAPAVSLAPLFSIVVWVGAVLATMIGWRVSRGRD